MYLFNINCCAISSSDLIAIEQSIFFPLFGPKNGISLRVLIMIGLTLIKVVRRYQNVMEGEGWGHFLCPRILSLTMTNTKNPTNNVYFITWFKTFVCNYLSIIG